jgi:hypothetical protein
VATFANIIQPKNFKIMKNLTFISIVLMILSLYSCKEQTLQERAINGFKFVVDSLMRDRDVRYTMTEPIVDYSNDSLCILQSTIKPKEGFLHNVKFEYILVDKKYQGVEISNLNILGDAANEQSVRKIAEVVSTMQDKEDFMKRNNIKTEEEYKATYMYEAALSKIEHLGGLTKEKRLR